MSTVVAKPSVAVSLPFRLRTALAVLLVCGVAATVVPRMRAAVRFYNVVGRVADYGLCMAGPTGATLLRDDPARFRQLVRRRLVGAEASARPFAPCRKLAVEISGHVGLGHEHELSAADYLEWGAGNQRQSLNGLFRVLPDLERMHAASWPFVRKPLPQLIRPSRGAHHAEHSLELAQPAPQRGLLLRTEVLRSTLVTPKGQFVVLSSGAEAWAYRSRDGGRNWTPTSVWQEALTGHAHHCVGNVEGVRFGLEAQSAGEGVALTIGTLGGTSGERLPIGGTHETVLRIACDDSGAVVLTRRPVDQSQHVFACASGLGCSEIGLPLAAQQRGVALDVARVARMNVIAWAKDGLVRVSTAKDRGAIEDTHLVFDARGSHATGLGVNLEPALIGFGRQLMLTLAARDKPAVRWALVADGPGAGFRSL